MWIVLSFAQYKKTDLQMKKFFALRTSHFALKRYYSLFKVLSSKFFIVFVFPFCSFCFWANFFYS
jgi:hypothetical protein